MRQTERILALSAFALSAACRSQTPPKPPGPPPAALRVVRTATVERAGTEGAVPVPGLVQARQRAALAARVPASVVALPFQEGDRVRAGAVVARLDDAALRSALVAAQTAGRAADADLARMEALLKAGAATPREVEESRARATASAALVASALENLSYAVLRAPFDASVAARPANVGDVVSPGSTILELEGTTGLEIRATAEADLVRGLRPGVVVEVAVDGQPAPLSATVRAVSAAGDPATHRFEVRADLPDAAGLRSGLFARLSIPSPTQEAKLTVPASAVFARGGLSGLFVVTEGRARLRWVAPGTTAAGLTEIRAGVDGGEHVVLDPAGVVDGQPVTAAPAGER
jgi:RND family efflux transporter MFP subunit